MRSSSVPPVTTTSFPRRRQQGAALLVALIFLVVLTILGIGVVGTTTTEEKLARNFRDTDIAFSAGEAALRDAEIRISGIWSNPPQPVDPWSFDDNCQDGLCNCAYTSVCETPIYERYPLNSSPSVELGTGTTGTPEMARVSAQPRYLIERVCALVPGSSVQSGAPCNKPIYRITALGSGRLTAQTTLQETYIP